MRSALPLSARAATAAMAALMLATAAPAQNVWRCGPEGRSYSATPCAEGRTVAVADPRSAADVAAAQAVAARESALARQLVQQRIEREHEALAWSGGAVALRSTTPASPAAIRPGPAARKPAKRQPKAVSTRPSRTATGGTSSAVAPGSPRRTG